MLDKLWHRISCEYNDAVMLYLVKNHNKEL